MGKSKKKAKAPSPNPDSRAPMTDAHRHRLKNMRLRFVIWHLLQFAFIAGAFLLVGSIKPVPLIGIILSTLLVLLIGIAVGGLIVIRWQEITEDLRDGQIESLQGPISLYVSGGFRRSGEYRLYINNHSFEISGSLYRKLTEGQTYRVVYSLPNKFVLETERI